LRNEKVVEKIINLFSDFQTSGKLRTISRNVFKYNCSFETNTFQTDSNSSGLYLGTEITVSNSTDLRKRFLISRVASKKIKSN